MDAHSAIDAMTPCASGKNENSGKTWTEILDQPNRHIDTGLPRLFGHSGRIAEQNLALGCGEK